MEAAIAAGVDECSARKRASRREKIGEQRRKGLVESGIAAKVLEFVEARWGAVRENKKAPT